MTYDWIAYNALIYEFPYLVSDKNIRQPRFYLDCFALLLKSGLIILVVNATDIFHLLLIGIIFAIWHITILVWQLFKNADHKNKLPKLWLSHLLMILIYCAYSFFIYLILVAKKCVDPPFYCRFEFWLIFLCIIIILHAAFRKSYLLRNVINITPEKKKKKGRTPKPKKKS